MANRIAVVFVWQRLGFIHIKFQCHNRKHGMRRSSSAQVPTIVNLRGRQHLIQLWKLNLVVQLSTIISFFVQRPEWFPASFLLHDRRLPVAYLQSSTRNQVSNRSRRSSSFIQHRTQTCRSCEVTSIGRPRKSKSS